MRRAALLAAILLSLGLAGCGGDDDGSAGAGDTTAVQETETQESTTEETQASGGADGEEVFASAGCGGCHTLSAAGASGTIGPNLDDLAPTQEQVAMQVENGGGAMPAFKDDLSPEEIQAVAEYVSSSAGS